MILQGVCFLRRWALFLLRIRNHLLRSKILPIENQRGMTMIEIMIVVAIIGTMMGIGVSVLFPGSEAKLREQSIRLAATIKFLYNEAAIKNKYYRLAFDLDSQSYSVESSREPFLVEIEAEQTVKKKFSASVASPNPSQASPAPEGGFSEESEFMVRPTSLPGGIKFKDISVAHMKNRQEQGKVYAYFFPNGWVEGMVINMADEDEENFYSLEVNPLTGKSKLRNEYYEVKPGELRPEVQAQ